MDDSGLYLRQYSISNELVYVNMVRTIYDLGDSELFDRVSDLFQLY